MLCDIWSLLFLYEIELRVLIFFPDQKSCRYESVSTIDLGRCIFSFRSDMNPPICEFCTNSTSIRPFSSGVNRHVLFISVTRKQQLFGGALSGAAANTTRTSLVRGS